MFERILVALDGLPDAEHGLERGVVLAQGTGARVLGLSMCVLRCARWHIRTGTRQSWAHRAGRLLSSWRTACAKPRNGLASC